MQPQRCLHRQKRNLPSVEFFALEPAQVVELKVAAEPEAVAEAPAAVAPVAVLEPVPVVELVQTVESAAVVGLKAAAVEQA